MCTLFDSARPVKPDRPFALGLEEPDRRMPYSAADLEWWAVEGNRDATDYETLPEPDWDAMAAEA